MKTKKIPELIIQDFEDILENYRGDYFKININKFNKLKKKWLEG